MTTTASSGNDQDLPDEEPVESCINIDFPTPRVVFAIDRSKSMNYETIEQFSHWGVVEEFVSALGSEYGGDFHGKVQVGLETYPQLGIEGESSYCDVMAPLDVYPAFGEAVFNMLGPPPMGGAAPLRAALLTAYDELDDDLEYRNAAVVIADGAPNCMEGNPLPEGFWLPDLEVLVTIEEALIESGVRTYVVGIGTSKDASTYGPSENVEVDNDMWTSQAAMIQMAEHGGTYDNEGEEPYLLVDSYPDIEEKARELAYRLYCDIRVPGTMFPAFLGDEPIEFVLGEEFEAQSDSCAGEDGIQIEFTMDSVKLNFCGEACTALIGSAGAVEVCGFFPQD